MPHAGCSDVLPHPTARAPANATLTHRIYPNDGEWWGSFAADGKTRLAMNETAWYTSDLFGLRTADEAGKIVFNSTVGDHLQFTDDELIGWVDNYFKR